MKFRLLAALSAAACLLAAPSAPAAFQFRLTTPTTTVAPGVAFPVNVYLDSTTPADTTTLQNGLLAAWVGLRSSGTASAVYATSPTLPASPGAFVNNPDFNDTSGRGPALFPNQGLTNILGVLANVTAAAASSSSTNNTLNGGSTSSLYIATINVRATSGGTLNLQGFLYDPSTDNVVSSTGAVLDGSITAGPLAVTVVPEPTSVALVGMAATGFMGMVLRKRRKAQTPAEEPVVAS